MYNEFVCKKETDWCLHLKKSNEYNLQSRLQKKTIKTIKLL